MEVSKETRARWLSALLESRGVPEYGRAATICKRLGCSNAVVAGWLKGSLPQDLKLGVKFCEEYGLTIKAWVYCETNDYADNGSDYISGDRLAFIVKQARCFEREHGALTDDQMAHVMRRLKAADNPKQELKELGEVVTLFGSGGKNNDR